MMILLCGGLQSTECTWWQLMTGTSREGSERSQEFRLSALRIGSTQLKDYQILYSICWLSVDFSGWDRGRNLTWAKMASPELPMMVMRFGDRPYPSKQCTGRRYCYQHIRRGEGKVRPSSFSTTAGHTHALLPPMYSAPDWTKQFSLLSMTSSSISLSSTSVFPTSSPMV